MQRLRRFHRIHALVMSLIVVTAALSGLIHTWMARSQSPPPPARPAGALPLTEVRIPPSALPGPAVGASLRSIAGRPWWQVLPEGGGAPRWVDATTGIEDPAADERYAQQIAEGFLQQPVTKTAFLTTYDREYIAIFRLLPVYRFDAADGKGTRVYVSTLTGSVARHTDDRRQLEANIFSLFHKWAFIPNRTIRDWALMIAMAGLVVLAVTGVVLFLGTAKGRKKV